MLPDLRIMVKTSIATLSLLMALSGATVTAQDEDGMDGPGDMSASLDDQASLDGQSPVAESPAERPTVGACLATPGQAGSTSSTPLAGVAEAESVEKAHLGAVAAGGACLVGATVVARDAAVSPEATASADSAFAETDSSAEEAPVESAGTDVNAEEEPPAPPEPTPVVTRAPKPKPSRPAAPVEPMKAWWPQPMPGKLNLLFAGDASFGGAIAVIFDSEFEAAASANQHIRVSTSDGKPVQGRWVLASNPKMLLFKADPGVYMVAIKEGLTAKGDRQMGASSQGAVFIP